MFSKILRLPYIHVYRLVVKVKQYEKRDNRGLCTTSDSSRAQFLSIFRSSVQLLTIHPGSIRHHTRKDSRASRPTGNP
jgi:hypothetical protein